MLTCRLQELCSNVEHKSQLELCSTVEHNFLKVIPGAFQVALRICGKRCRSGEPAEWEELLAKLLT
jgi:hypothetical protein